MNNQQAAFAENFSIQPVYIINPKTSTDDLEEALHDKLHSAYALTCVALAPSFLDNPEIIVRDYFSQLAEILEEAKNIYTVCKARK